MSENNSSAPYGYNGRGNPSNDFKEQQQSAAIGDSMDAAAKQRYLELLKSIDSYIPPKTNGYQHSR